MQNLQMSVEFTFEQCTTMLNLLSSVNCEFECEFFQESLRAAIASQSTLQLLRNGKKHSNHNALQVNVVERNFTVAILK